MAERRAPRRLAAILAADVAGYSRLVRADEEGTLSRLSALYDEVVFPALSAHDGRIVKTMGDGLLVEFASAVDAVRGALAMQKALSVRNGDLPEGERLVFRIGINLGDVVIDGDDIQGDGVNIAARLEALAEPGGICISGAIHDQVRDRLDDAFQDMGQQSVKNIDRPVPTWRWIPGREGGDGLRDGATRNGAPEKQVPPDRPSIAVLPFSNLSGDPEQKYFSDGITEDIITALSRIRQFFVIARNTSFTYDGQAVDVQAAAAEMDVQYVLEGSVRKAGNRVRITAQLIDGGTGRNLWAERYDRNLDDIFEVQDEITQTVVGSIEPELAEAERDRAKKKATENLAVWDRYQRGMAYLLDRDKHGGAEDIEAARTLLEGVVAADPNFADGYSGLALAYHDRLVHGFSADREADIEKGLGYARQAVALASDDAQAHTSLAGMHRMRREFDLAIDHAQIAVDLNPNSGAARRILGTAYVWAGKAEEALPHLEMSMRLSPRDPLVGPLLVRFAEAYFQMGDLENAFDHADKAIRRPETQFWGNAILTAILANQGRTAEAQAALRELLRRKPDFSISLLLRAYPPTAPRLLEPYLTGLRAAGVPEK